LPRTVNNAGWQPFGFAQGKPALRWLQFFV
jgi:hypothetical protein